MICLTSANPPDDELPPFLQGKWIDELSPPLLLSKVCLSGSEFETGSVSFYVSSCLLHGELSNRLYKVYELVGHQSKVDVWDS